MLSLDFAEIAIIDMIATARIMAAIVPNSGTTKVPITSIVSALAGVPVKKDVAMTGEVTLRGRVLPIGGLKEKLLAALRGGIKTAIIPSENEKDLKELPKNILDGLKIIPVKDVEEVLKIALVKELNPIEWIEVDKLQSKTASEQKTPIN